MLKRLVTVIGATGAQGIPVVKALVKDGRYLVRAATRDPSSPEAKLIASWPGVSLAVGNVFSEPFLREIFTGAQAAFVNTNGYVVGEKGELYWGSSYLLHFFSIFGLLGNRREIMICQS